MWLHLVFLCLLTFRLSMMVGLVLCPVRQVPLFFGFNFIFFNGYIGILLAVSFLVVNNIIITL